MDLTNEMFNDLMSIKKRFDRPIKLPTRNNKTQLDVVSLDGKEKFIVDLDRSGNIEIKSKLQNRYSSNQVLIRVEINAPPHTNPDGTTTSRNHIHIYKEGFNLSWAYEFDYLPKNLFNSLEDFNKVFIDFCLYCNIKVEGNAAQTVMVI